MKSIQRLTLLRLTVLAVTLILLPHQTHYSVFTVSAQEPDEVKPDEVEDEVIDIPIEGFYTEDNGVPLDQLLEEEDDNDSSEDEPTKVVDEPDVVDDHGDSDSSSDSTDSSGSSSSSDDSADPFDVRCKEYEFPIDSFPRQIDTSKVYLTIDKTADGPFKAQGLTKYSSAFGVRVVAQSGVEDSKIYHMVNLVAELLDQDGDGTVDHPSLQTQLLERYATMFIVESQEATSAILSPTAEDGFPPELKYCPFSFDYEEASKIIPGGEAGEQNCPEDLFVKDRSVAFASDHVIGRGWPRMIVDVDDDADLEENAILKELNGYYEAMIAAGDFDVSKTGCPDDDERHCGQVMFTSWIVTILEERDKCWCHSVGALKVCDSDTLREKYPDLVKYIETHLLRTVPTGKYDPKANGIIVTEKDDDEMEEGEEIQEANDDKEL